MAKVLAVLLVTGASLWVFNQDTTSLNYHDVVVRCGQGEEMYVEQTGSQITIDCWPPTPIQRRPWSDLTRWFKHEE